MTARARGKARACERAKNILSSDVVAERTLTVCEKAIGRKAQQPSDSNSSHRRQQPEKVFAKSAAHRW